MTELEQERRQMEVISVCPWGMLRYQVLVPSVQKRNTQDRRIIGFQWGLVSMGDCA